MPRYSRKKLLAAKDRFWKHVHQGDVEHIGRCWRWMGCRSSWRGEKTYGNFYFNDRMVKAHRFAWELCIGPIPKGLQIDHLCKNKWCVNPLHMEPVTQRENMLRGTQIERAREWAARITHCPHGHEYTPENTRLDAGKRKCRECCNARLRALRARRKAESQMTVT